MKVTNDTRRLFTFNVLTDKSGNVVHRIRFIPGQTITVPKQYRETLKSDKFFLAHVKVKNLSVKGVDLGLDEDEDENDDNEAYSYTTEDAFLSLPVRDMQKAVKHLDAAQVQECLSAAEVAEPEPKSAIKLLKTALNKFG